MIAFMPNAIRTAVDKVVDAWTIPGPDPAEHYAWQELLKQPSPQGWPMLAKAVQELVAAVQEQGNKSPR